MIPKIIYMCYKNLQDLEMYSVNWKKLNPEYEIKLYDNDLCEKFLLEEFSQLYCDIFKYIKDGPIKADFWRVCVLYKYGGVYVDADVEPLVPIKDYINEDTDFVSCISSNAGTNNWSPLNPQFIMAKSGDILLQSCIDEYVKYYLNNKPYTYWSWSICKIFDFKGLDTWVDGDYILDDKKFQFVKEKADFNIHNFHCVYKNIRVFNCRYAKYDYNLHTFVA
jgi:mannosyltransferase OCH1-like enzyme